jgi:hypothetical protein
MASRVTPSSPPEPPPSSPAAALDALGEGDGLPLVSGVPVTEPPVVGAVVGAGVAAGVG